MTSLVVLGSILFHAISVECVLQLSNACTYLRKQLFEGRVTSELVRNMFLGGYVNLVREAFRLKVVTTSDYYQVLIPVIQGGDHAMIALMALNRPTTSLMIKCHYQSSGTERITKRIVSPRTRVMVKSTELAKIPLDELMRMMTPSQLKFFFSIVNPMDYYTSREVANYVRKAWFFDKIIVLATASLLDLQDVFPNGDTFEKHVIHCPSLPFLKWSVEFFKVKELRQVSGNPRNVIKNALHMISRVIEFNMSDFYFHYENNVTLNHCPRFDKLAPLMKCTSLENYPEYLERELEQAFWVLETFRLNVTRAEFEALLKEENPLVGEYINSFNYPINFGET